MSDPKKPRNPANALFGLDDVPISTSRPPSRPSTPTPSGPASQGPADNYGYSFGRPAATETDRREPDAAGRQQTSAPQASVEQPAEGPSQGPASSTPQYIYVQAPPTAASAAQVATSAGKGLWTLVIILLAISGVNLYLVLAARSQFSRLLSKQADQLTVLTRRADSSDDHLAELGAKFAVTAERLGMTQAELTRARQLAVNIERQQQRAVTSLNAAIAQKASAQDLNSLQTQANTKFGTLTGNLLGTQKDLDATKEALTGAKGELTSAIAHTHDELVTLAHRTDRDYFEFRLSSKGARQKIGGVQLQLVKTNTKMNLFTVNLFFDDKRTQRKNQSVDEPLLFYMQGAPNALEMVVNHVAKNAISGYISAPKGFIVSGTNVLTSRPTA
jgi:hypothetical protein